MVSKGIVIEIKGVEETIAKLKNITEEKLQKAEQGIKKAGFHVQAEVQMSVAGQRAELMSVDTGRFLNSVKTTFPAPYTASVETNVSYAPHLEYGTTRMEPRRHFSNTAARETSNVKEIIKQEVK
jgi:hypothetical protein